ncbi:TerB family tellurite resistance protein [Parachryseolinea silvisoli]|uniref:TerB family tellurite resistance protein n=1 Tax=Parachryseolinea silvisoli TaxID=2873601 RepID=UPI002265EE71|nr:TerB family tellurite resistance protein [Parachryseolinea silvisoli]MCD9015230.1 TerB family tellurite resistance protein [Parachryseolinea silvisoli]
MKRLFFYICLAAVLCLPKPLRAQTQEATQLILNYEKLLQLEEILDKMYKGYKILSAGYNTIKDIAEGNFNLHKVFLDGLFAVNPSIKNYRKVAYIVEYQQRLVKEYKKAYERFSNDPNLTAKELQYIQRVFEHLVKESLNNLEELVMVVTASRLRMNDEERFQAIDRIYSQMENKLVFLKVFNGNTQAIAIGRAKDAGDISTLRKLYGVTK